MRGRISASEWNQHVRHLGTRYPLHIRRNETPRPTHPWQVTPIFDAKRKRWTATVRAGSVNAIIATITVPADRMPEAYREYLRGSGAGRPGRTQQVDVPLDFAPALDLAWREIGGAASPISTSESGGTIRPVFETVPLYFQRLGVIQPGSTAPTPLQTRRLFACDLVLRQPRSYLINLTSLSPGGALGGSIVSVDAGTASSGGPSDPARVVAQARYVQAPISNSFADIFFQRFLDDPFDELHLSTVYALSQPLGEGQSLPQFVDETFEIMTRYYCHYNLAHATRTLPRTLTVPITLVTGLAAGLGDAIFNLILSTNNDFAQASLDLFAQRSLRGSFWVV